MRRNRTATGEGHGPGIEGPVTEAVLRRGRYLVAFVALVSAALRPVRRPDTPQPRGSAT